MTILMKGFLVFDGAEYKRGKKKQYDLIMLPINNVIAVLESHTKCKVFVLARGGNGRIMKFITDEPRDNLIESICFAKFGKV